MGWMDVLKPIVNAGVTAFSAYQQQKDQDNYVQMMREAETARQDYDQQMLAYQMAVAAPKYSGGGGGGGGGGGRPKMTQDMLNVYQNYNQKSEDVLMPWINAGKSVLPAATDGYAQSLAMASNLLKQMSTEDVSQKMWQSQAPSAVQFNFRRT